MDPWRQSTTADKIQASCQHWIFIRVREVNHHTTKHWIKQMLDIKDWTDALKGGLPPVKLPKYVFGTAGCYSFMEEKLRPILEYEDLKTGVFQVTCFLSTLRGVCRVQSSCSRLSPGCRAEEGAVFLFSSVILSRYCRGLVFDASLCVSAVFRRILYLIEGCLHAMLRMHGH